MLAYSRDFASDVMDMVHELGINDAYVVVPNYMADKLKIASYVSSLSDYCLLARYGGVSMSDSKAIDYMLNEPNVYFVVDNDEKIVAEFQLTMFSSLCKKSEIHFSFGPGLDLKVKESIGHLVTDNILLNWTEGHTDEPYMEKLVGAIPTEMTHLMKYVLSIGFIYSKSSSEYEYTEKSYLHTKH